MNLISHLCFMVKLSLGLIYFTPSQIHSLVCILNENESTSPQLLNIFDIESQSNSTCCRIKLTDISSESSEEKNKLCFTESANGDNINFDSIEETSKSRTLIKVSGKFYPSSKESDSSPVNAICMKGEIVFCTQLSKKDTFPDDLSLSKANKHRRKTLFDENNSDDNSGDNDVNNEKSNDVNPQNHQEIIIVAPNEPDSSSNQDIKVEYVIGEEVKLACLLESRDSNEVIWMKDNLTISSQPSAELVSDTEYQIFHNSINSFIILNVLKITINSANASGLYTCAIKSNSSTEQGESMSFQVIATSSREYAEYKFKRPNITGFIVGMIPSIMLFFYIIMSLGYRSRYAMEQEEEEEGLGI